MNPSDSKTLAATTGILGVGIFEFKSLVEPGFGEIHFSSIEKHQALLVNNHLHTLGLEDNFEVVQDEEYFQNAEKTVTTGKVVYIYAVNQKDKSKKFIGEKRYRSKSGITGKTSNTIQWSPDMQKCFDK